MYTYNPMMGSSFHLMPLCTWVWMVDAILDPECNTFRTGTLGHLVVHAQVTFRILSIRKLWISGRGFPKRSLDFGRLIMYGVEMEKLNNVSLTGL